MLAMKTDWGVSLCLWCLAACSRETPPDTATTPIVSAAALVSALTVAGSRGERPMPGRGPHDMPDDPPLPPRPVSDGAVQIRAAEILISYKGARDAGSGVTRSREEAKALANHLDIQARAGADFEGLVLKYSDDPRARERRGDLGRFGRAQFDQAFTAAAFELMKQEIGIDPVETDSGFHIIKRTE